jgi:phage tail sheath protein FI
MPEYLSPGVYVEEIDTGLEPIEGVSTSVTGFVGVTQRGPLDTLPPVLVTSFPEFQRLFGGYFMPTFGTAGFNLLPHAVAGFFNNGGKLLYIKRVAATGGSAPKTSKPTNIENNVGTPTVVTRLTSNANAGTLTLSLQSLRGIQKGTQLVLTMVKNGITTTSSAHAVDSYIDGSNTVKLSAKLADPGPNYEAQLTTVSVAASGAFTPAPNTTIFSITAADPGAWGNHVQVQIRPSSRAQGQVQSLNVSPGGVHDIVVLNSSAGFYVGAIVEFNKGQTKVYRKVKAVRGSSIQVNPAFGAATDLDHDAGASFTTARTCEFDILATWLNVTESLRGLTLDNTTPFFYANTIVNQSTLLTVPTPFPKDNTTEDPSTQPLASDGLNLTMAGGDDGGAAPTAIDFAGTDGGPGNRTGIAALIDQDRISIIAAPGIPDQTTQQALIDQCENLRYRFAILDPAPTSTGGTPGLKDIQAQRDLYDTKYAAIYYPRLVVLDPLTNTNIVIPPSGHVAGIYARTDDTRGVWKAPANVVINGILDLEVLLNKGDQDILNPEPNNINVLRDFRHQGRGLRVYGARCITTLTEWKYINVRRLFIFLEASLDQGTQFAVFEPNHQKLWDRLIQSVSAFLTTIWREGGLAGAKPEQAFFVKCGTETMSQDDIENGRLIMLVGVAPVFPAEFVIIRIGQFTGGSSVTEP